MTGFMWVCSDNEEQQYLLNISIHLAKRYYPQLPRLVLTSDSSLSVDAECLLTDLLYSNDVAPDKNILDCLVKSPFEYTYFLCNRTMIISNFDHVLTGSDFEAQIRGNTNPRVKTPYQISNAFIAYSKSGVAKFDSWYKTKQLTNYMNSQHLLADYYSEHPFKVHSNLLSSTSVDRLEFLEALVGTNPRKIGNIPFTHWLNFPLLDLDNRYKEFEKIMWINDYDKFKERLY
jgi:hypothetical protein